jgi:hypothetical protein
VYACPCRRCHGLKPALQCGSLLLFDPFSDKQLMRGFNILRCVLLCGKEGAQQLLDQGFAYAKALDSAGALSVLTRHKQPQAPQGASSGVEDVPAGNGTSSNSSSSSSSQSTPRARPGPGADHKHGSNVDSQTGMLPKPATATGALLYIEDSSPASICSSGSNISLLDLQSLSHADNTCK